LQVSYKLLKNERISFEKYGTFLGVYESIYMRKEIYAKMWENFRDYMSNIYEKKFLGRRCRE